MFKSLNKKIAAGLTATALGFSMTTFSPAVVEAAIDWGGVIGAGISGAAAYKQINAQIKTFNETEEGRTALMGQFQEKYGVNEDPVLNARLDKIMANLTDAVAQIDPSINDKPYKYFVSADKSLNAACSLGHVMMVNTGAFDYLATDDEIAAIVGHEMGHGQKDHVAKGNKSRINQQVLAQAGVSAAGGGTLANIVGSVMLNNSVAHSDKNHETEADNLAWEYMLNTNYNIGACAAVMQRLSELYGGKARNKLEAWLNPSNHPNTDKRRDNYVTKLYEYSGKHATAKDGVVTINGKEFMTVAAANGMSSAERAYFVLGNLARAYHDGENEAEVTVYDGTIYLGNQTIVTPADGDEDVYALAERLSEIK
ncbi:MAG: M48 family metallopeptidase [Selenomonadaceae bacterium]|nr:M48 family metallopeptidase [Selenomonadaceae bacterium]